ncbi:MAG TPA: two-component system response regulator [Elusimicrobia bacterium]|nr:two-component system response regulator [Elusimicrobiota bacterium]
MPVEVLIVEDDPEQARLIQGALGAIGWRCHVAATAADARDQAVGLHPPLVITDIQLPDGNGFDLCRELKGNPALQGIRVIMVTGTYQKDEDRLRAQALGADAYLLKPFHIAELIQIARRLVGA